MPPRKMLMNRKYMGTFVGLTKNRKNNIKLPQEVEYDNSQLEDEDCLLATTDRPESDLQHEKINDDGNLDDQENINDLNEENLDDQEKINELMTYMYLST